MGIVYVFFIDGFEEIEASTSVDVMRCAGLKVETITVTPDETATGAHGVSVLCDKNITNYGFFDIDLIVFPGGVSGMTTLRECDDLRKLVVCFAEENKPIAAICAAPVVLGKLGLLKGRKAACCPGLDNLLEGVEYTAIMVEKDGNITAGKDPGVTMEFALAVVELLQGKDKVAELRRAMIV